MIPLHTAWRVHLRDRCRGHVAVALLLALWMHSDEPAPPLHC